MNILEKIVQKVINEKRFYFEQKFGWVKPADIYDIPKHILRPHMPKNAIMIDCGAHYGSDSIELARIFPDATVHAFEPVPFIFDSMRRNTSKYRNIKSHKLALGPSSGSSIMYVSSGTSDASSSLLPPKTHIDDHPDVYFKEEIKVETLTLDDWAAKNNISRIDFLWLDMQGIELETLQASPRILSTVTMIHTEVSTKETYENVKLYQEVRSWLEGQGFEVISEAIPAGTDMGNALFLKKKAR
jgi:FkbM family methyltransferase